jgi:hypothetical protein
MGCIRDPAKKYPGSDLEVNKAPDSGSATLHPQGISLRKIKKQVPVIFPIAYSNSKE